MRVLGTIVWLMCAAFPAHSGEIPRAVSLVSLLASPAQYNGANVIVTGYLCRNENNKFGLFLTRADCEEENFASAIEVTDLKKRLPVLPALLVVEGRFEDRSERVFTDEVFIWGVIQATNVSGRTLQ